MTNPPFHAKHAWRLLMTAILSMAVLAACSSPVDDGDTDPDGPAVTSVEIEAGAESLSLRPDQSRGLDWVVEPADEVSQEVVWTSEDGDVASVDDNGVVSANGIGATTVTATSVADPDHEDTIRILVSSDAPEYDFDIVQARVTLAPGDTQDLLVDVVVPEGESEDVAWESDDESVVTVAGGTLTAVGEGTATVTGTLVADDDFSDSVAVTVSEDDSITIQQDDLTLYPGEEAPLGVDVQPDGAVTWTTSNPDAVTIDGADTATPTITGVAEGTSTITVASVDDPELTDQIMVTVEEITIVIEPADATADLTIAVGETLDLDAIVGAPEGETGVTWESGDMTVATVDADGVVRGEDVGTTTITATSEFAPGVSATVELTVEAAGTGDDVTVTIEPSTPAPFPVGDTVDLSATVEGAPDGETGVTWVSGDTTVATVDAEGVVTGEEVGSTTITATSTFDTEASASVTVEVVEGGVEPPPGIDVLVSVAAQDSDPYSLQEWEGEEPIPGTLRHALAIAEPGDVIGFEEGINEVVVTGVDTENMGTVEDPDHVDAHLIIRDDVTIVGPPEGITIRAESGYDPSSGDPDDGAEGFTYQSRVMFVLPGADVTLENVTISGGDFIFLGGGIRNDGALTLRNVTVTDNRAWTYGGGVFNNGGTISLENSDIVNNAAYTSEEEVAAGEYFIRGEFRIEIRDTGYAGGLAVSGGTVEIDADSLIEGNSAKYIGGGVSIVEGGSLVLDGTSVSTNTVDPTAYGAAGTNGGGGVAVYAGQLVATDATFTDNQALWNGGGLWVTSDGTANLDGVTFTGNTAEYGDAIYHDYVGDDDPSNLTITGGNVQIDGEDYYSPDAPAPVVMRSLRTDTPLTLPAPFSRPEWRR